MYEFLWWWMFLLLPLPLILRYVWKAAPSPQGIALRVPFIQDFIEGRSTGTRRWLSTTLLSLAFLAWAGLITASARPVWIGDPVNLPVSGRDIMLVVDLSGSMLEQDFMLEGRVVDRLVATKAVARNFIDRRSGDRIGMVVFADNAYLQAPLTFDHETVKVLLDELFIGLAGQRTAIGDALGVALRHLRDSRQEEHIIVLLTDGANNSGVATPLEAADMARAMNTKIYTIGIGAGDAGTRQRFGMFLSNPAAELDERVLREVANRTGGRYYLATNVQAFQTIYDEIDRLEPIEQEAETWRPQHELFRWPLAFALFMGLIALVIRKEAEN